MRVIDIQSARFKTQFPEAWESPNFSPELSLVPKAQSIAPAGPLVAILLCIFQGKKFLSEQLDSIANQSHRNWRLYVSDDGDCVESIDLIRKFKNRFEESRIVYLSGPRTGFAQNFLSLLVKSGNSADYYAFADQDDIWQHEKISKAVQWLESVPENTAALYCGRTRLVDKHNKQIGFSPLFKRPPSFANALVQSVGGANTMVMNKLSRDLLTQNEKIPVIVSHDWWAYLVVAGCGGKIYYDPVPSIRYRQHENNLVGSNVTLKGMLKRILMLLCGNFSSRIAINLCALESIKDKLTLENKSIFENFKEARESRFIQRLILLKKVGIHRQTFIGNLGLVIAAIFRKL